VAAPDPFKGEPEEQPLVEAIAAEEHQPLTWQAVARRLVVVVIAGIGLYLVLPTLTEVFDSWPRLRTLQPWWFGLAILAQAAHFTCTFALQRLALRTKAWFSVVTAQLAGNSVTLIVPGGAAAGAAVQFRMLEASGIDSAVAVGGLTTFSLLGIAGLLALPIFALPAIAFGAPVNGGLLTSAMIGLAGFVLFAGFGAVILVTDAPLRWTASSVERAFNRLFKKRTPMSGTAERVLRERNEVRAVLGEQWKAAVLLSAGRLGFDYLTLLFCLRATGSHPRPSLVLLAYAVTGIIGLVPITPGGLGIVEASLAGFLVLAGVPGGAALLATLAYRLASYWLPLAAGPIAYGAYHRRALRRAST
jgi:uncharacterized protein (TIRG00374 family)